MKNNTLIYFLTGILVSFSTFVLGQTSPQLQTVIPPSADAAALGEYGVYPVELSKGLPEITIPLYTIKSGTLELPLSLSYHASGIKVDEVASWAGLGWVLNAGGVVTRTVRGKADETGFLSTTFLTQDYINHSTDRSEVYNYLYNTYTQGRDGESDRYAYNANGMCGSFIYTSDHQMLQIPFSANKIIAEPGVSYTIVSDNGTTYTFDVVEQSSSNGDAPVNTSFYLSKIISADKTDAIYFDYTTDNSFYVENYQSSYVADQNGIYTFANPILSTVNTYQTKLLSKIRFKNGYVDLIAAGDRKDRRKYRISQLNIYSSDNLLKRTIKLWHSHFQSSTPHTPHTDDYSANIAYRLRLDSVQMVDALGAPVQTYSFSYYSAHLLPSYWGLINGDNPQPHLYYGQDTYGYYNGVTSNSHFQYKGPPLWLSSNTADRSIHGDFAQTASLSEIKFPTGGRTKFTYESNNATGTVGGLRIQKIESFADDGIIPAETKVYSYGPGMSANSFFWLNSYYNYTFDQYTEPSGGNPGGTTTYYGSSPSIPLSYDSDNGIFYNFVTETATSPTGVIGKTENTYEFEGDLVYPTNVLGSLPLYIHQPRYLYYFVDMSWARGPLKMQDIYKSTPGGAFILIKRRLNTYQSFNQQTNYTGTFSYQQAIQTYMGSPINSLPADAPSARAEFQFFDIVTNSGAKKLVNSVETSYANGKALSNSTNYYYENPSNLYLTRTEMTNSKGEVLKTVNKYPQDKASIASLTVEASLAIDNLVSNNQLTPIIETEQYNGVTLLNRSRVNYSTQGTQTLPRTMQMQLLGNPLETRVQFNSYDASANLLEQQKADDMLTSYIWDYQSVYPVAEVRNASATDIAYTSFEADGNGNWSVGSTVRTGGGISGSQSYNLPNGACSKSGLSSTASYIVSYWSNAGSYTVSGSSAVRQGKSIGSWTYYEHTVSGVGTVVVSGSGGIDELRLYPISAQMTSYTYLPLIGVSSQCGVDNRITYYEYDALGRLKDVKDQDGNIIKTYEYHYKH